LEGLQERKRGQANAGEKTARCCRRSTPAKIRNRDRHGQAPVTEDLVPPASAFNTSPLFY